MVDGYLCLLGYSALFKVIFARDYKKYRKPVLMFEPDEVPRASSFIFYVHHGAGFATTPAGKLTRLIRFMTYFDADVFMLGHVHDQEGRRQVTVGINAEGTKLVEKL